jgi:fructose-bisphosphate aldolase, class I
MRLNGKTDIPPDGAALSPVHASVADAVRLGADAVKYPRAQAA